MRKLFKVVVFCTLACAICATAQTNTFPASGKVGIGTTDPQDALDIEGGGYLRVGSFFHVGSEGAGSVLFSPSGNYMRFMVGTEQSLWLASSGSVGIGTSSPYSKFDVNDAASTTIGLRGIVVKNSASATADYVNIWNYSSHVYAIESADSYTYQTLALQPHGGSVGIGTTSPGAKLEVNGTAQIDGTLSVGGGGIVFPNNGGTQTVAWTGTVCGGDYAESVDVSGDRTKYAPGDVLVIDPNDPSKFLKSSDPYSPAVAGVYSTKPGVTGRRQTTVKNAEEIPMAVVGIVPVKVSAENGAIRPSDLLVAAAKPGYAMKGTDRGRMLGAVIGKAMGTLNSGTGVIEVLVTLQ